MKRKKTRRYISGMIVAVLLFLLCVVQNVNAEDVPAGSGLPRLVDDADILTDSEEKELNQQLDTVSTNSIAGTIWCGWRRSLEFMKKFKRFQRNLMRTC